MKIFQRLQITMNLTAMTVLAVMGKALTQRTASQKFGKESLQSPSIVKWEWNKGQIKKHISEILMFFVGMLVYWQTVHHVSDNGLDYLLRNLFVFFQTLGLTIHTLLIFVWHCHQACIWPISF